MTIYQVVDPEITIVEYEAQGFIIIVVSKQFCQFDSILTSVKSHPGEHFELLLLSGNLKLFNQN